MTDLPYIVIGSGGHARVILGVLRLLGEEVRGLLTLDVNRVGNEIMDAPIIGTDGKFPLDPAEVQILNGVGNRASRAGSGLKMRADVTARYEAEGFVFSNLIAPNANIMPGVLMAQGVQIMAGATLQPGVQIGAQSIINTNATIDHDVTIGAHTHIAPGAILCGGASVGDMTHVGAGAVVIQGITIGRNCVIGAGVTVRKDVADGKVIT
ncbi:MAG: acetyltransferase [Alphaproteobacteria bacterium]|jgi:UDP-perosamine 4-acetyltransferase